MESFWNSTQSLIQVKEELLILLQSDRQQQSHKQQQLSGLLEVLNNSGSSPIEPCQLVPYLKQLLTKQGQHNLNKAALGQLSIKLIDCILELQETNHENSVKYQQEIEQLQSEMQYLNHKNIYIQGNAEETRQELIAAHHQLEALQQQQSLSQPSQQVQSPLQIQISAQLQPLRHMRGQNGLQRGQYFSDHHPCRVLLSNKSQQILPLSSSNSNLNQNLIKQNYQLHYKIETLEEENQRIKKQLWQQEIQIQILQQQNGKQQEEQEEPQMQTCHSHHAYPSQHTKWQNQPERELLFNKSPSIMSFHQEQASVDFNRLRSNSKNSQNLFPSSLQKGESTRNFNVLSHEFSAKSFGMDYYQFQQQPRRNVIDDEDEKRLPITKETRQTEMSQKQFRIDREVTDKGVNTDAVIVKRVPTVIQNAVSNISKIMSVIGMFCVVTRITKPLLQQNKRIKTFLTR